MPASQRLERQVEVELGGHGDHDRVHVRRGDGLGVAPERVAPPELPTIGLRSRLVPAGVAGDEDRGETAEVTAVHAGDEATPEKGHVHRRGGLPLAHDAEGADAARLLMGHSGESHHARGGRPIRRL